MTGKFSAAHIALAASFVLALVLVPTALAGKPAAGGGGGTAGSSISLVMVADQNGNTSANFGDSVTFNVSSSATSSPQVKLTCYQGGTAVMWGQAAFYAGNPFSWTQIFPLNSGMWTSGAADCTAVLFYTSGRKTVTLKTLNFHVDA